MHVSLKYTNHALFYVKKVVLISSVESQKGVITIQRCSIENQKGAIAV